jgi:ribonuclease P protein component
MLTKQHRLTKERDFKQVLTLGKSFFGPSFKLRYLAKKEGPLRVAVVVSAKISKKATVRNKLKRRIRDIFRLNLDKIKDNYDIITYLSHQSLKKSYPELKQEVLVSLNKAKLLK